MFGEEIIRQEHLGLVVKFLKDVRQQGVVEMAAGENEVTIDFTLRIR
jgi:hypothetical protein